MPNLLTAQEVADQTGLSVDHGDIARAQSVIEVEAGVDLSVDPLPYTAADIANLKRAVLWQTVYLNANPDALQQASNVVSASANGSSLTFSSSESGYLSPVAARALAGLSWRRNSLTLTSVPVRRTRFEIQPDPWRRA